MVMMLGVFKGVQGVSLKLRRRGLRRRPPLCNRARPRIVHTQRNPHDANTTRTHAHTHTPHLHKVFERVEALGAGGAAHEAHEAQARAEQLLEVLVGRHDDDVEAGGRRARGERCDDVVGLDAGHREHGHAHRVHLCVFFRAFGLVWFGLVWFGLVWLFYFGFVVVFWATKSDATRSRALSLSPSTLHDYRTTGLTTRTLHTHTHTHTPLQPN
jgi:hypothetical protein